MVPSTIKTVIGGLGLSDCVVLSLRLRLLILKFNFDLAFAGLLFSSFSLLVVGVSGEGASVAVVVVCGGGGMDEGVMAAGEATGTDVGACAGDKMAESVDESPVVDVELLVAVEVTAGRWLSILL